MSFDSFAVDCVEDQKLVVIDGTKIGYNMYDKKNYADEIHGLSGGGWSLQNNDTSDLSVVGQALCLNTYDYDYKDNKIGSNCFCKIKELDKYNVLADWVNVKQFQKSIFNENATYPSEIAKKMAKDSAEDRNRQDCMKNCAKECQNNLSKLVKAVKGYYGCGKAIYKKTDVKCVIDRKIINAKHINVFDDVAEINMGENSIVFTKDASTKSMVYEGSFEYEPVYLKIKNNNIYVGRETYSMEECL